MALEWWMATAAANVVMVLVYGAISVTIILGIARGKQWTANPIAVATAAIFVTCTVGHGLHLVDALLPVAGGQAALTAAARVKFSDPLLIAWDVSTAFVAVWYWTLRSRLALIYRGASLCEDMVVRQKQAAALHETVVDGLAQAQAALAEGRRDEGRRAVDESLDASRRIITGLMGSEEGRRVKPGDLRRRGLDQ